MQISIAHDWMFIFRLITADAFEIELFEASVMKTLYEVNV
jgi:hypothetical protein